MCEILGRARSRQDARSEERDETSRRDAADLIFVAGLRTRCVEPCPVAAFPSSPAA